MSQEQRARDSLTEFEEKKPKTFAKIFVCHAAAATINSSTLDLRDIVERSNPNGHRT
jgi:hypothetical protein